VGSRRRSATQAIDLPSDGGVNIAGRITLLPHPLLPCVEIAAPAPHLEVRLGLLRSELLPRLVETGTRFLEGLADPVRLLSGVAAGMKPAAPSPLLDIDRHAGPDANVADADIAEKDEPAFALGSLSRRRVSAVMVRGFEPRNIGIRSWKSDALAIRRNRPNLFPPKLLSNSKRSNFENRTESVES